MSLVFVCLIFLLKGAVVLLYHKCLNADSKAVTTQQPRPQVCSESDLVCYSDNECTINSSVFRALSSLYVTLNITKHALECLLAWAPMWNLPPHHCQALWHL